MPQKMLEEGVQAESRVVLCKRNLVVIQGTIIGADWKALADAGKISRRVVRFQECAAKLPACISTRIDQFMKVQLAAGIRKEMPAKTKADLVTFGGIDAEVHVKSMSDEID